MFFCYRGGYRGVTKPCNVLILLDAVCNPPGNKGVTRVVTPPLKNGGGGLQLLFNKIKGLQKSCNPLLPGGLQLLSGGGNSCYPPI